MQSTAERVKKVSEWKGKWEKEKHDQAHFLQERRSVELKQKHDSVKATETLRKKVVTICLLNVCIMYDVCIAGMCDVCTLYYEYDDK